ncbi:MAG TPA: LysR family transcriptional regulator [Tissierellia bacterium]|jgi:molybdate transport system regulatory protein|nr:LysR family transcriptional regulator [Tissierellia bacterium]
MKKLHYILQIRLAKDAVFFGPGVRTLLRLTDEYKSLNEACKIMNLSYSKALKMVKGTEKNLGFKLLDRKIGGLGGGGSSLTPKCIDFLNKYDEFEKELTAKASEIFDDYFNEFFNS